MGWVHALAKPGVRARQRIATSDYKRRKRLESYEFAYKQALVIYAIQNGIFDSLDDRHRKTLELRYLDCTSAEDYKTLEDVGSVFNITRAGALVLEKYAIRLIEKSMGDA